MATRVTTGLKTLEWVTNRENCKHAIDNGLWENQRNAYRKKRPIVATNVNTGETIEFESVCEAQKKLNTKHISAVLNGKRTKAKGYTPSGRRGGFSQMDIKISKKQNFS